MNTCEINEGHYNDEWFIHYIRIIIFLIIIIFSSDGNHWRAKSCLYHLLLMKESFAPQ